MKETIIYLVAGIAFVLGGIINIAATTGQCKDSSALVSASWLMCVGTELKDWLGLHRDEHEQGGPSK
jgi:hypothetical protein